MSAKRRANYEDLNVILRLYEIRREEKLREARAWFGSEFFPRGLDDITALLTPDNPHNAQFRMVISYWDMAASFAIRGPLDAGLLLESAGELLLVWAKLEPFVKEMREWAKLPDWLRNLEEIIQRVDWAPRRVQWLKEQFASRPAAGQAESANVVQFTAGAEPESE